MCGRYASSRRDAELVDTFEVDDVVGQALPPSWNVAPTQHSRAVLERSEPDGSDGSDSDEEPAPRRQLRTLRWGLVPSWAKDASIGNRMINARIETVTEKPAFKRAASRRRLLIPADGYFEWQKGPGRTKTPFFMSAPDGAPLAFGGLYELWPDPSRDGDDPGRWWWTFTIITAAASDASGQVHERTPLVIPPDMHGDWLDASLRDLDLVRQVLDAVPEPHLAVREVSSAVNSPAHNGPELVDGVNGG